MSTTSSPSTQEATKYSLRDANAARQAEWGRDNQITLEYRGNEMAGEVGEACNVIKKLARERMGIRGPRDTVEHLAEELADVVICADLIAMAAGIDLDAAVQNKFNATSEKNGLVTRLAAGRLFCGACGGIWQEGMSCAQKDNGHDFRTCYAVAR